MMPVALQVDHGRGFRLVPGSVDAGHRDRINGAVAVAVVVSMPIAVTVAVTVAVVVMVTVSVIIAVIVMIMPIAILVVVAVSVFAKLRGERSGDPVVGTMVARAMFVPAVLD